MTTEADLMRAVCAEPASDEPRLILADWLQEHGNDDRAEFIRVQIEASATPSGCVVVLKKDCDGTRSDWCLRCRLVRRERELLIIHADDWTRDLPGLTASPGRVWAPPPDPAGRQGGNRAAVFRCGFVEVVTLDAATWLTHGDALRQVTPLREVRLTTVPEIVRHQSRAAYRGYHAYLPGRWDTRLWYGVEYDNAHLIWHLLAANWPGVAFHLPS